MEAQQHGPRDNPKYQRQSNQPVVDEAESAYSSALSLAQTFEGAKNVLISMNVETVDGKMAPSLPWLNRIKLCLMNQIDDKAVNAAGLNILSFILLLQLQQNRQQQQINVPVSASLSSTSSPSNSNNTVSVLRSLLCPQQLYPNHQYCSLTVEVNFDRVRFISQIEGPFSECIAMFRKQLCSFNWLPKLPLSLRAFLSVLSHRRTLATSSRL